MAQKVNIVLVDDLDGSVASETVMFGLDGNSYEIDLSESNAAQLRDSLAPYLAVGRRLSGRRARRAVGGTGEAKTIRDWARSQGMDVPSRGRIPAPVKAAYDAAH